MSMPYKNFRFSATQKLPVLSLLKSSSGTSYDEAMEYVFSRDDLAQLFPPNMYPLSLFIYKGEFPIFWIKIQFFELMKVRQSVIFLINLSISL